MPQVIAQADTLQEIELAEGVLVNLRPAGALPRGLAYLIDAAIIVAIIALTGFVFGMLMSLIDVFEVLEGILLLIFFFEFWGYFLFFERGTRGATPGKRSMGLRVVQTSGAPPTTGQVLLRNVIRVVDFMPFANALGVISIFATKRFQRLGDIVAGTLVVYADKAAPKTGSTVSTTPVAPPIPLSREEQVAVAGFLDRVALWSPERQQELASLAEDLTGEPGKAGITRLLGMGAWLRGEGREDRKAAASVGSSMHFSEARAGAWAEFGTLVDSLEKNEEVLVAEEYPRRFRQTCNDLALARDRMYGLDLVENLNDHVSRGYRQLHRDQKAIPMRFIEFFWRTFPNAVRAEWRIVLLCTLAFFGPLALLAVSGVTDPRWVEATLDPMTQASLEDSWSEGGDLDRGVEGDFMMFCFYVFNNVTIGIYTFASGLLCGIGAIFILLFNGIMIGAVTGYVHHACHAPTFYSFVAGHSAPELIGIVLSGAAGMRLGLGFLKPGRRSLADSVLVSGKRAFPLALGAFSLIFFAAFIEGFWSARPFPPNVKYAVGIGMWILVILYLALAGLGGGSRLAVDDD